MAERNDFPEDVDGRRIEVRGEEACLGLGLRLGLLSLVGVVRQGAAADEGIAHGDAIACSSSESVGVLLLLGLREQGGGRVVVGSWESSLQKGPKGGGELRIAVS